MKENGHTKNKMDRGFFSRVNVEKGKSNRKNEGISERYRLKLEHSEELNPDDFE